MNHVIGHAMASVLTSNDSTKMNTQRNSDKPCLPSFAKAKEKQRHTQANAICFCPTAQRPFNT